MKAVGTMTELSGEKLAELRKIAGRATPGPWSAMGYDDYPGDEGVCILGAANTATGSHMIGYSLPNGRSRDQVESDGAHIAAFDPPTVLALLDRIAELEAELGGIRARDQEVNDECEGWSIGGAWGDYGEVVVPLRILSYVIDGELGQQVVETDAGFAVTYAEQVARAEQAEAKLAEIRRTVQSPYIEREQLRARLLDMLDGEGK
ncbi:hypothetical protein C7K25_04565 [Gulosibacter molinativorax]|uniref:Uncharacterized protein n=2 Tax=Gulosibacter molinativorax TaxID=256821 RepID=A0ABT7C645_9MICO|nr:hypothetical protein [Gulosibacter molinativorax]